jgi:hypothetical protein
METTAMQLHDLTNQYNQVLDNLLAMDKLTEDIIQDTLAPYRKNIEEEVIMLSLRIEKEKAEQATIEEFAQKFIDRGLKKQKQIERLMNYLKNQLKANHIKFVKSPLVNVCVALNPHKVEIFDDKQLPAHYIKEKVETYIDKKEIKEDLKNGVNVPGAKLIQDDRLQISI